MPESEWYIAIPEGTIDDPMVLMPQTTPLAESDHLPDADCFLGPEEPPDEAEIQRILESGKVVALTGRVEHAKTMRKGDNTMSHWDSCNAIERRPDKVSGAWIFENTRLPVATLFEALKNSPAIDQFLDDFEGVTRQQVVAVLDHEINSLEQHFEDEDTAGQQRPQAAHIQPA